MRNSKDVTLVIAFALAKMKNLKQQLLTFGERQAPTPLLFLPEPLSRPLCIWQQIKTGAPERLRNLSDYIFREKNSATVRYFSDVTAAEIPKSKITGRPRGYLLKTWKPRRLSVRGGILFQTFNFITSCKRKLMWSSVEETERSARSVTQWKHHQQQQQWWVGGFVPLHLINHSKGYLRCKTEISPQFNGTKFGITSPNAPLRRSETRDSLNEIYVYSVPSCYMQERTKPVLHRSIII